MHVETLHLEITRNCTLECEHCLRGDRQTINMNPIILDKIFKDVKKVDFLLLTGGEPLLADEVIERLKEIIETKRIRINKLYIISNGTVLTEKVLNAIKEITKHTYTTIDISVNIFHELELKRLGLTSIRDKNLQTLKDIKLPCMLKVGEHGKENERRPRTGLVNQGKARNITSERLAEINSLTTHEYFIYEEENAHPKTTIYNDTIEGNITIDVYGNIVSYGQTFEDEDIESQEINLNVLTTPFNEAVTSFIEQYLPKKSHSLIKKYKTNS